jgi:hypothetical protein
MVVAATALLVAAVARMEFLPSEAMRLGIWAMPVLIAMAAQYRSAHKCHPVYLIGLGVFAVRAFGISVIAPSAAWGSVADWVFGMAT